MLVFIGFVSNAQPVSGTFTINSALETAGTNFQSFSEAVDFISAGVNGPVVFNVSPLNGSYFDQVTILPVAGTSATNTITFNCNGATMEFSSSNPSMRAAIKLDGADHIIFDSLKVIAHTLNTEFSYGWGFVLLRDADSNIIRKCTVNVENNSMYLQNTYGIMIGSTDDFPNSNGLSECDGNIITQNTVIGGNSGIMVNNFAGNWGTPVSTITGNQVTNNKISNFIYDGIEILWTANTLVEGNEISLSNGYGAAINITEFNSKLMIRGNRIHNFTGAINSAENRDAITISYCYPAAGEENSIENNLVYNFNTAGSKTGINIDNSSWVNIYHNTIVMDDPATDNSEFVRGISLVNLDTNVNCLDNIVVVSSAGSGDKHAIYTSATNPGINLNNNNLYNAAGFIGRINGNNYATITDWQSGSGKDFHSVSIDPVFADASNGNYRPSASVLDNMGAYVNVDKDITGAARSNTGPDMGAFEFLASPCSTPPVAGAAKSLPGAIVCAGSPITISTTGNSGGTGQTYQWQTSTTETGSYSNVGNAMLTPSLDTTALTNLYYRLQISCASVIAYTVPVLVKANTGLAGGTYTINKALPTSENNFQSFADVLSTFKCGISGPVVFNVVPGSGPYNEQVIITAVAGSSATNTITINGNGQTLEYLSTSSSQRAVIKLNGASNIIIDSLNVTALGSEEDEEYGFGIQLINNADGNIIRRCRINVTTVNSSEDFAGIVVSARANNATGTGTTNGCDDNQFTGNTITGGYYGLTLSASTTAEAMINNNKVLNNKFLDFHNIGLYVYGTTNTLVEGNDFSRPARTISGSVYGVYVTSNSTGLRVSKNRIHNLFDANAAASSSCYGIYTSGSNGTELLPDIYSNNIVYNIKGTSGAQYGIYHSGSAYAHYYHNTISLDDSLSTTTNTTRGFHQTGTSTGLDFKNNIITIRRGGTGIIHGMYINGSATMAYTADNNNYFINSATGVNNTGYFGGTGYVTLAEWKTASGKDAASLAINPLYADAGNGDLKFTASVLDNKGVFVNITTDISGLARSNITPDPGAYEVNTVLPVKVIYISASKIGNDILINWSTATEINTKSFVIERSTDGTVFSVAGTISASGNSNTVLRYSFTDKGAAGLPSPILYYRIRTADLDGKADYTKTVAVSLINNRIVSAAIFPNPMVSVLYAKVIAPVAGKATIQVKDATGRLMSSQSQQVVAGTNLVSVDNVNRLSKGIYFVSIAVNDKRFIIKVTK
ncbi:MAG: T9SS type A sorting domain-containing protein [Ferruginibacter sp.]